MSKRLATCLPCLCGSLLAGNLLCGYATASPGSDVLELVPGEEIVVGLEETPWTALSSPEIAQDEEPAPRRTREAIGLEETVSEKMGKRPRAQRTELRGNFQRIERDPDEYAARYTVWRKSRSRLETVPGIGTDLRVTTESGRVIRGAFVAFDHAAWNDRTHPVLWLSNDRGFISIPVGAAIEIRSGTDSAASEMESTVRHWIAIHRMPMLTTIWIRNDSGNQKIPIENVEYIRTPEPEPPPRSGYEEAWRKAAAEAGGARPGGPPLSGSG